MAKISVRQRGRSYEYRFAIAPVNGVRKWIQKSGFRTKAEAERAGAEALTEYNNAGAPYKPCNMSYSDYLDYWFDNYCKKSLVYNTNATYETIIRLYIKPKMGMYRLADINSVTIDNFITDLVDEHKFSRAYYQNILKVVKGSFKYAVTKGFLKYNPSLEVTLPRRNYKKPREKHIYSQKEIDMILERFKSNRVFICAFLTACYTGMRTGEVLALTWDDIDFYKDIIKVNHGVYDKTKVSLGRWYRGRTKNKGSKRTIPLAGTLKKVLLNYKKYQDLTKKLYAGDYKKYGLIVEEVDEDDPNIKYGKIVESKYAEFDLDFVFTKEDGTYSGTDIIKNPYDVIKKEFNIDCRYYDLRGSFVTYAYHNGIKPKNIATIVGHNNVETINKYYLQSINVEVVKAVDKMNELISSDTISNVIKFEC